MEESPQSSSAAPALIGCQGLEQFLLLAKTARGPAVSELIRQALDAPGVYVFGELLETECVKDLASSGEEGAKYVQLLELFAYGTYVDYKGDNVCMISISVMMCVCFATIITHVNYVCMFR